MTNPTRLLNPLDAKGSFQRNARTNIHNSVPQTGGACPVGLNLRSRQLGVARFNALLYHVNESSGGRNSQTFIEILLTIRSFIVLTKRFYQDLCQYLGPTPYRPVIFTFLLDWQRLPRPSGLEDSWGLLIQCSSGRIFD